MGGVRRGYLSTPLTWNRLTQTFDFSGPAGVAAGDVLIQSIFKMEYLKCVGFYHKAEKIFQ